jgi:hypothetical protein
MKPNRLLYLLCAMVSLGTVATIASGQEKATGAPSAGSPASPAMAKEKTPLQQIAPGPGRVHPLAIDAMAVRGLRAPANKIGNHNSSANPNVGTPTQMIPLATDSQGVGSTLPLWTFRVQSSRDGDKYSGAMVGTSPFNNPGKTKVPTKIIPLIIKTQAKGTSFDTTTGIIGTAPGETTFDPTQPDNVCLTAPNNIPTRLLRESPIFTPTKFVFGGTNVGTTQYSDAFQRANFWQALGEDRDIYHVLLEPRVLDPIVLEVPAVYGIGVTDGLLFGPPAFCGGVGIVDINWFDTHITGTLIPGLKDKVGPEDFPIFLVYNVLFAAPVNNLGTCCILGYHGTTGFPIPTQTYSPAGFNTNGFLFNAAGDTGPFSDTAVLSHEVDEWVNDPMVSNPTPPWGNTGQVVGGCQANLEVGDPLSGTILPPVKMPNGYTYHLQELAFFSWFFGTPSIGANGWFSNNGTFLTDAGPPCH